MRPPDETFGQQLAIHSKYMRRRPSLLLVVIAAAAVLVLTVVGRTPQGVIDIRLDTRAVRADPEQAAIRKHDLSALEIFNLTLVRLKDRYVDPSRLAPRGMLCEALNSVQLNLPEVLVESDVAQNQVVITVNDQREVFDISDVDKPWRLAAKMKRIFRFIETNMNAGADLAKLEYSAINGMLSTLDPHSVLIEPEPVRGTGVPTSGKLGSLGLVIRMIDHKVTVVRPMGNTPASRAGIKRQDRIVRINQELTENMTSDEAIDRMRGEPDTGVTLWIEREGAPGLLPFNLFRAIIRDSQVTSKLLGNKVGVIRAKQFSKGIARDVADAMKALSSKGARAWILDLRGSPGGLLEESAQLTDLFVNSGTVMTTVSGRNREVRRAERGSDDTSSPLVVLVNTASASGSEIVAGALKDLDRAVIVGTRTFGNASLQELYDNPDGSKLKLTIAQWLTPDDRSIQSVGIVPDIALQRMWVPERNQGPGDAVHLLEPTRSHGEKDLDAHLTSTYAKDTDKPAYEVAFQLARKPASPSSSAPNTGAEEDDELVDDDITGDFEIGLASKLAGSSMSATRSGLLKSARSLVAKIRADEEKRLISSLGALGIDWSAPPTVVSSAAALEVKLSITPTGTVNAGDVVAVTATVKNNGTGAAWRVLARLHSDDGVLDDYELPIGKIALGETRAFTSKIQVPNNAFDRVDRMDVEVREALGAKAAPDPISLRIKAAPRPTFAYTYQLVDDGNGDGLVEKGEKYRLLVSIKNTGEGSSPKPTAFLRNASGPGVLLDKSRFELSELAPGAMRNLEFPLSVTRELGGEEFVLEMTVYDAVLETQVSEKLHFPLQPGLPLKRGSGSVAVRADQAEIRAGASIRSTLVGWASKGGAFPVLGTVGPWTKIGLGGNRPGFISSAAVESGSGAPSFKPYWQSTPPSLALVLAGLETSADHYSLKGTITDDSNVEDVFVVVSNSSAKVDSKKVYYRSNRKGRTPMRMDFEASVPLWPGTNQVTVVARDTSNARTVKTLFINAHQ